MNGNTNGKMKYGGLANPGWYIGYFGALRDVKSLVGEMNPVYIEFISERWHAK